MSAVQFLYTPVDKMGQMNIDWSDLIDWVDEYEKKSKPKLAKKKSASDMDAETKAISYLVRYVTSTINALVPGVKTDFPYKAQGALEYTISYLQGEDPLRDFNPALYTRTPKKDVAPLMEMGKDIASDVRKSAQALAKTKNLDLDSLLTQVIAELESRV